MLRKEEPLNPFRRNLLIAAAAGLILGTYLLALGGILVLAGLILLDFILVIVALRFGGARIFFRWVTSHCQVLMIFLQSGWINRGESETVLLTESDAPELFRSTRALCQTAGIEVPDEIHLALNLNASVRLRGLRKGKGRSILTVGLDLLAALNVSQVEAVLAHEIMHALHVQRGATHWLRGGMVRIQQLTLKLKAVAEGARQRGSTAETAEEFWKLSQKLARQCTRLVAACSRQDEFDADRGAAELCGTEVCRSALITTEKLGVLSHQIPLRERVARRQMGVDLKNWLVAEFVQAHDVGNPAGKGPENGVEMDSTLNPYSTHPTLADRLAALPPVPGRRSVNGEPGLSLLTNPESVADRLFDTLNGLTSRQEAREGKVLRRNGRRAFAGGGQQPLERVANFLVILGSIFVGIGTLAGIAYLITQKGHGDGFFLALGSGLVFVVPGMVLYRLGGYRADFDIPIPDHSAIRAANHRQLMTPDQEKQLVSEIEAMVRPGLDRKKIVSIWSAVGHAAMGQCDYPKAFVASRACIRMDQKSIPAAAAWLMSCAVLGHHQVVPQTLEFLRYRTGLPAGPLAWAAAWSLFCVGDWVNAEFFLERCLEKQPEHHTLHALLAVALMNRNKFHGAVAHAREAQRIRPNDRDLTLLLANSLIKTGQVVEATTQLKPLNDSESDAGLLRLRLEIQLLTGAEEEAVRIRKRLEELVPGPQGQLDLASLYESNRRYGMAEELFGSATRDGFFPTACLGLARGCARKGDFPRARGHILNAINLLQPVGVGGTPATVLFNQSLQQLLSLSMPVEGCHLWWTTVLISPQQAVPRGTRFIVVHRTLEDAFRALSELWAAMIPGFPPLLPNTVEWREGPRRVQPQVPVIPGVHSVQMVKL